MSTIYRFFFAILFCVGSLVGEQPGTIHFLYLAYDTQAGNTRATFYLSDGSSWVSEPCYLDIYTLEHWQEGHPVTVSTNGGMTSDEYHDPYYQGLPGYLLENVENGSEIVVLPTKQTSTLALKIKDLVIDEGWFSDSYFVQLEDDSWWEVVDGYICSKWKPGQRVWFGAYNRIINLDIMVKHGTYDNRKIVVEPLFVHAD